MESVSFNRNNYKKEDHEIILNCAFPEGNQLCVVSEETGNEMMFEYDRQSTGELEMANEGWDGEMYVRIYRPVDGKDISLHIWNTPYNPEGELY